MKCISCGHDHDENFCPKCGQKSGVKRITLPSILEEAIASLTYMDKGFLFNVKSMVLQPSKIVTDYIQGKRKGILNPISFLIISVTIYLIVISLVEKYNPRPEKPDIPEGTIGEISYKVGLFVGEYLKYFWILAVLPLGFSTRSVFRKYNYIEHLAVDSFILGVATLIGTLSYLAFRIPLIFDPIVYLAISWLVLRIFWDPKEKFESFAWILVTFLLFVIQLVLILVGIGFMKA